MPSAREAIKIAVVAILAVAIVKRVGAINKIVGI